MSCGKAESTVADTKTKFNPNAPTFVPARGGLETRQKMSYAKIAALPKQKRSTGAIIARPATCDSVLPEQTKLGDASPTVPTESIPPTAVEQAPTNPVTPVPATPVPPTPQEPAKEERPTKGRSKLLSKLSWASRVAKAPAGDEASKASIKEPLNSRFDDKKLRYKIKEMIAIRNAPQCIEVDEKLKNFLELISERERGGSGTFSRGGGSAELKRNNSTSEFPRNQSQDKSVDWEGQFRTSRPSRPAPDPKMPQFTIDGQPMPAVVEVAVPAIAEDSWQGEQKLAKKRAERGPMLMRRLRAQLNKMTPATYADIFRSILSIGIENEEETNSFVRLIFEKAISNHQYIEMYALLCSELKEELATTGVFSGDTFRRLLLSVCQATFQANLTQDWVPPEGLPEDEQFELLLAHKAKMKGNLMFVGQLCWGNLVTPKVLNVILQELITSRKPMQLEALAAFLPTCISNPYFREDSPVGNNFWRLVDEIRDLSEDPSIERRVRYLLEVALEPA